MSKSKIYFEQNLLPRSRLLMFHNKATNPCRITQNKLTNINLCTALQCLANNRLGLCFVFAQKMSQQTQSKAKLQQIIKFYSFSSPFLRFDLV